MRTKMKLRVRSWIFATCLGWASVSGTALAQEPQELLGIGRLFEQPNLASLVELDATQLQGFEAWRTSRLEAAQAMLGESGPADPEVRSATLRSFTEASNRELSALLRADQVQILEWVEAARTGVDGLANPSVATGLKLTADQQKAIGELLIGDYSRKGFLDGIALRLPTICIRPGAPNKAASGFFSNILREPLVGKPAILPVPDTVRHWHASPRAAVGFLIHAATMDLAPLGARRALSLPGLSATVAEQIEALRRVAGSAAVALIRREDDPAIRAIVDGWPQNFTARRALDLGFRADDSFDQIIQFHIQDELGGS